MAKTILVVEDDADIRETVAEMLELHGYLVFTASNGKEGIHAMKTAHPDLVLCDIMMPKADGYEVLQSLKSDDTLADVHFIFMTAKNSDSLGRLIDMTAIDAYLDKPFDLNQLLHAVEGSLNKPG